MRRIILLLAVAAMMAAMMVATAAPAMARASQFLASPEGTTLSVAPAAHPTDPFQPGAAQSPQDPFIPSDPFLPQDPTHCTQGSNPICPKPIIT